MGNGCVSEVDLYMAYRQELPVDRSVSVLRHVAGCPLCHDQWKRFELDEQMADGIQCAIRGDTEGADTGPGWGLDDELPEQLEIPGFDIRPGYIEGGQACVYRGTYEASQEEVAIKVFHNSILKVGGQERFAREVKSLARLRHPNVITIRSDGQVNGHPYFVMPWIESLTLDEYVKLAPLSLNQRVDLVSKICDAVAHAHRRGVMHLDLKPTNVRVDANGEPVVMDFGLAKLTEGDLADPPGAPLVVAGTPLYMAPEQLENRDDLDARADVYSLGLLLYEVLLGRRAKGAELTQSQRPSLNAAWEVPPPPRTVDPKVPSELEAITLRAIEVNRDRRYQTAWALYEDLRNYRQGLVVRAKAHQHGYRLRKWIHLYRETLATLTLILFVMGFGVVTRMYLNRVEVVKLAEVEEMRQQAYAELIERQQKLAPQLYGLNRACRDLILALQEIELLAREMGDLERADASHARALEVLEQLNESEPLLTDLEAP